MRALTLSSDTGSWDTSNPESEAEGAGGDTGDFMQTLASLFGGGPPSSKSGGGLGENLGMLAGAGLGTLVGPAGTTIGAGLGKAAGAAVERLVKTQTTRAAPPSRGAKRRLSANERKILADGDLMTKKTGNRAYADEAALRVYRPAEYRRRRAAGTLPTRGLPPPSSRAPAQLPPPSRPPSPQPASPSRPAPSRQAPAPRPKIKMPMAPTMEPAIDEEEMEEEQMEAPLELYDADDEYNETAAPDPRPRPIRHTSVMPLPRGYMEALLRDVPAAKSLDPRLMRLASGSVSVARDVSGVDPSSGTYHALGGETPHGITKKLTGQVERVAELLAANPGKSASSPVWNIPPGWLVYDRETGALATARKYVVQPGDSPFSIAKKLGASSRAKWFSELKVANPQKPVKNGNFVSLHAGEELGVPDDWPESPLAVPVSGGSPQLPSSQTPAQPSTPGTPAPTPGPGLPGPGQNSTMDPGAILQVQLMLARWAKRHPNVVNPSDFGTGYDLTSTMTPRTVLAIQSFQLWWTREHPLRPLRMDGVLDNDTVAAIKEAEQVESWSYPQPAPSYPYPMPQQPFPQQPPANTTSQPAQWPFPFPSPYPTQQPAPQPQQHQPQPQPVPQQQQPAPQPQQQQSPAGWPFPFPNPYQQQQQQPQQQQPAPQQQQSPQGWPFPFPNPYQQQQPPQQQPAPQQQQSPQGWPFPFPNPYQQQPQQPQQQPAPQQQQSPQGWPFPFPNPYQQQQQPAPQQQQSPQGWPFPFPNPYQQQQPQQQQPQQQKPAGARALGADVLDGPQPGPYFDQHMPPDQQEIVRYIINNEKRIDALELAAKMYEASGYPIAAQTIRDRAMALSTNLDSHIPPDQQEIIRSILANERRPGMLDVAAAMYDGMGYPLAAAALRQRANVLRGVIPPVYNEPYPDPWPAPPYPNPDPNNEPEPPVLPYPTHANPPQTSGADSTLVPVLALLGAGLAFS